MSFRVRAATPAERERIAREIHYSPGTDLRGIVATDRHDFPVGGVLYDRWTHNSVQMHMWLPDAIAGRALLRPAFAFPFEEAGLGLVLGFTPEDRPRACRLAKHLGFLELYRIQDGEAKGVPMIVFGMRREACPHLQRRAA